MADQTDWDDVWKDRISKKFDVEDIEKEEQTELRDFLKDELDDTATITRSGVNKKTGAFWSESHQVEVKPQLLKYIDRAKGYQELQKVMKTKLTSSKSLKKLQQEVTDKADELAGLKVVKALEAEGERQKALNLELTQKIRKATNVDRLNEIRDTIKENRELLGRSANSLLRIADFKEETF